MFDIAREELESEFNARFDYISEAYGATARDAADFAMSEEAERLWDAVNEAREAGHDVRGVLNDKMTTWADLDAGWARLRVATGAPAPVSIPADDDIPF